MEGAFARRLQAAEASMQLLSASLDDSEPSVMQRAVDLAVELTDSEVGYIHYINTDQDSIELCTWSSGTMGHCSAIFDRHYPISRAGIWADTARFASAQVHNDYAAVPHRRGLPPGHAAITRHLGVAAMSDDGLHLLMGVGNAERPYDEQDVAVAQQIVDSAWQMVSRLREYDRLRTRLQLLERGQSVVRQCTWEWDPFTNAVLWDPGITALVPGLVPAPTWQPLLDVLDLHSRLEFQQTLDEGPVAPMTVQLRAVDDRNQSVTLLMQGYWADRPQGRDCVMRGTIMDVSVLTELDRAHDLATHDAMTGLPNRAWLVEELSTRLARLDRRASDHLAVHFIDFDNFKEVNDRFGHVKGDEVLIECAHRLQALTRQSERVARYGGDEFVLIQNGPISAASALALGQRIRRGIADRPVMLEDNELEVSVSIGAAVCAVANLDVTDVLERADAALYAAKRAATGVVVTTL